jgi:hypothetical protein
MSDEVNIIRVEKNKNYAVINTGFLKDKNLSLKAKGLLAYILTLPDDWKIYINELASHHKDGKDSVSNTLNELIKNKYISRKIIREGGKFKGYSYKVFEIPVKTTTSPKPGFPETVFPETENPSLHNINKTKYLNNKVLTTTEKENVVVVKNIIETFKNKYKGDLDQKLLNNLIKEKGIDVIEKCIDIFGEYVSSANEVEKVFYKFCKTWGTGEQFKKNTGYKNYNNNKPTQATNYEQREYDDKFFDSLYDNVDYIKEE